jgi:FkbM family methyltransferase
MTVLDVGAHVGATIAQFTDAYPAVTVHAFEPASDNLTILRQRFAPDPRVRIHAIALSSTNQDGILHLKRNTSTHSLIPLGECIGSEPVQIATMDTFCERERLQAVSYCKIDTEGGDLEVLRGASALLSAQRIDFVQVETSMRHDTKYFAPLWEIDGFLNEKRYELFGFYDQKPWRTGSLGYFNAVYVRSSLIQKT